MFKKLILVLILAAGCYAQDAVWFDSTGLIVELKEKYGSTILDTCTVLTIKNDIYYTTHRDGLGGTYPLANWSARIIRKGVTE